MFLEISPELIPILIPLLCVFVPTVILAIIVLINKIVKHVKMTKNSNNSNLEYETYFGGKDNISNIEIKLSRVNVTVNDIDLVDFDKLKELNMGVLVVGNVIKCASSEFVEIVEKNLNKNK